jgi:hypothetical protein
MAINLAQAEAEYREAYRAYRTLTDGGTFSFTRQSRAFNPINEERKELKIRRALKTLEQASLQLRAYRNS